MTPQQTKILLDSGVLQAYAEGKEIQYFSNISPERGWQNYEGPQTVLHNTAISFGIEQYSKDYKWRVKPEKKTGWINIYYTQYTSLIYPSKEVADNERAAQRIACIQITYEEGEGL